jgi:hypothetical protein
VTYATYNQVAQSIEFDPPKDKTAPVSPSKLRVRGGVSATPTTPTPTQAKKNKTTKKRKKRRKIADKSVLGV